MPTYLKTQLDQQWPAFPDVDVDGGDESITEFDKLMITFMRANSSTPSDVERASTCNRTKKGWTTYFWSAVRDPRR